MTKSNSSNRTAMSWLLCTAVLLGCAQQTFGFSAEAPKVWTPKIPTVEERRHLRGLEHGTETIGSLGFHHIEFYCSDAKSATTQFALSLGMKLTGMSGQSTGNDQCCSYGLESGDFRVLLTAPYSTAMAAQGRASDTAAQDAPEFDAPLPLPGYLPEEAHDFFRKHGLAARAIGLHVRDAKGAFERAVANGARPVLQPTFVETCKGQRDARAGRGDCHMAEVELYGDVVLRLVSFDDNDSAAAGDEASTSSAADSSSTAIPFMPHLAPAKGPLAEKETFGIHKIDHAVGNVHNLAEALEYVATFTGFHEFAEFTAEDVGTVDSGLNSVVLASDSEDVLIPLNEPTPGRRKSQIQTYLEQNEGPGLQHIALKTNDIFDTIRRMRKMSETLCGFELMAKPSDLYYEELPGRLGDQLTPDQYRMLEEEGILADADDEGVLLQVFTRPIGDRPTLFLEIIQRVGCVVDSPDGDDTDQYERPGCGGFGKGNFRELFRSIEDLEKTLKV